MGLIMDIIAGAAAVGGGVIVKILADDAKEWTPRATGRLLALAVWRLPECRRERCAEEWSERLYNTPGVIGKLALVLQFQLSAQLLREADARARLDEWMEEQARTMAGIRSMAGQVLMSTNMGMRTEDLDEETLETHGQMMKDVLHEVIRRCDEIDARTPSLGLTVVGVVFTAKRRAGVWASAIQRFPRQAGKRIRNIIERAL